MTSASSISSGPVRVLSLDGGGVRGFAELVMLEKLFQKLNHFRRQAQLPPQEPWEFFDMIGGTSTGGLIAVMLGRLKTSIRECLEHYRVLSDQAFSKKNRLTRALGGNLSPLDAHYDTAKLGEAIKTVINDSGPPRLLREEDEDPPCKVFVMSHLENLSRPACFRSYENIEKSNELYETITIWEACRATSAATTFFDSIVIGGSRYSDGGLQYNNPISIAYAEALEMFPGRQLQIVSLGTGTARPKEYNPGLVTVAKQLAEIATATHNQTQVFLRNWNNANGQYFRFNPNFVGEIGLEEAGQLDEIRRLTVDWIEETETSKNFVACAKAISGATVPSLDPKKIELCRDDLMRGMTFHTRDLEEQNDRVEGSCAWILQKPGYKNWESMPGLQLLTITGEPGIGKSALAAFLVERVQMKVINSRPNLAYFFCSISDPKRNSAISVMRVLLSQLVAHRNELFKHILEGADRYNERKSACFENLGLLWNMLKDILEDPALGNATIIVDGLDEIVDGGPDIIDKMKAYVHSKSEGASQTRIKQHIGVVFVSQPLRKLDKLLELRLSNTHDIRISRKDISRDLNQFINENINAISSEWEPNLSEKVLKRLKKDHEGTFQVVLQSLPPPGPSRLFYTLTNQAKHVRKTVKGYWQRLTVDGYVIYEQLVLDCLRRENHSKQSVSYSTFRQLFHLQHPLPQHIDEVWTRLLRDQNDIHNSRHPVSFVLAVLYMLHMEQGDPLFKPDDLDMHDQRRREALKYYCRWVRCRCDGNCGRTWSFANDIGISRGAGSSKKCRAEGYLRRSSAMKLFATDTERALEEMRVNWGFKGS